jgi:hypothetical protein
VARIGRANLRTPYPALARSPRVLAPQRGEQLDKRAPPWLRSWLPEWLLAGFRESWQQRPTGKSGTFRRKRFFRWQRRAASFASIPLACGSRQASAQNPIALPWQSHIGAAQGGFASATASREIFPRRLKSQHSPAEPASAARQPGLSCRPHPRPTFKPMT